MKPTSMNSTPTEQNLERRGGAPRDNRNRMRHGLTAAKLPAGCAYIENRVGQFRRQLESEVIASHDEIGVYYAALIQSAVRHETRAKLLQRWLRESENEIKTTTSTGSTNGNGTTSTASVMRTSLGILEKSQLLRDISGATDSRDKCLEKLNLHQSTESDQWPTTLPALPTAQDASESIPTTEDDKSPIPTNEHAELEAQHATAEEIGQ